MFQLSGCYSGVVQDSGFRDLCLLFKGFCLGLSAGFLNGSSTICGFRV